MAKVTIWFKYADGDQVQVSADIENDYPDAMSEAVRTCSEALREAMVCGIVTQAGDEDESDE